jgi:hypothetical protein
LRALLKCRESLRKLLATNSGTRFHHCQWLPRCFWCCTDNQGHLLLVATVIRHTPQHDQQASASRTRRRSTVVALAQRHSSGTQTPRPANHCLGGEPNRRPPTIPRTDPSAHRCRFPSSSGRFANTGSCHRVQCHTKGRRTEEPTARWFSSGILRVCVSHHGLLQRENHPGRGANHVRPKTYKVRSLVWSRHAYTTCKPQRAVLVTCRHIHLSTSC